MVRVWKTLKNGVKTVFGHYSAIVISIIPCIIVSSLVGAILNICTQMPLIQGRPLSEVYPLVEQGCSLLQLVFNCGIFMIPVYVMWSTVRHFGGTELYALYVGMTLVPAGLINGMDWSASVMNGTAEYWDFVLFQIPKAGFHGQMLVAILSGVILVWLEKKLTKAVPKGLYAFVVPLTCVAGTTILAYLVVGPFSRMIENGLVAFFHFLLRTPGLKNWGGLIMGLVQIPMMTFGLHLALISVNLQEVASGAGSPLWPITVASVLACGAAALAVLIFTKDKEMKEAAREGVLITLGLGTVEPALFGVCCKNKCAFIGAVGGAAIAAFLSRVLDCTATGFGLNGFLSFLNYPMELWGKYALVLATSIGCSFTFTSLALVISPKLSKKSQ